MQSLSSLEELFDYFEPYYLAIGMPADEYWNGDPWKIRTYEKAYEFRKAEMNQELWLQGMYNFEAFRNIMENFSMGLSGKNGNKPKPYPREPIPITQIEKDIAKAKRKRSTMEWVKRGQLHGNTD